MTLQNKLDFKIAKEFRPLLFYFPYNTNMALTQSMATKATNPHLNPVSLSTVPLSMEFNQLLPQIGSLH